VFHIFTSEWASKKSLRSVGDFIRHVTNPSSNPSSLDCSTDDSSIVHDKHSNNSEKKSYSNVNDIVKRFASGSQIQLTNEDVFKYLEDGDAALKVYIRVDSAVGSEDTSSS